MVSLDYRRVHLIFVFLLFPLITEGVYPSGILINEILPAPRGGEEWIEILNQNNFEVDLSGWQVKDLEGKITIFTFPKGTKLIPLGFLVLPQSATKIILNNEADGLALLSPDGKIADQVSYENAPFGQSYNRTAAGWDWSIILTQGRINIISAQETKEGKETKKEFTPDNGSPQIIDINSASLKELEKLAGIGPVLAQRIIEARPFYSLDELTKVSGIGEKILQEIKKQGLAWVDPNLKPTQITKETKVLEKGMAGGVPPLKQAFSPRQIPKFLATFLIALSLAIFSGIIILILKKKIKTPW